MYNPVPNINNYHSFCHRVLAAIYKHKAFKIHILAPAIEAWWEQEWVLAKTPILSSLGEKNCLHSEVDETKKEHNMYCALM